ncbi:MAG: beta-ketoacyl-[acyl-carrier-protein] synthase family protein [Planctomycetota bacterium]|jgi:3-oxoacyl-[acyl-carrier-protein] synthase II
MKRRVAITGIGVISPLGFGHEEFWKNLTEGRAAIGPITSLDVSDYPCKLAAEVKGLNPSDYLGDKGLKYLTKGTKFLASASKLALEDAGLMQNNHTLDGIGVVIGSALGNYPQTTDYTYVILKEGPEKLLPMDSYDVALNSSTNFASVFFKLTGPSRTITSGFTSSTDAIGNAYTLVQKGRADVLIAGGVEQISLDSYLIFLMRKLLAGSQDSTPEISTPFDMRRNGFILSEGSYVFVLEDMEFATRRGARIYAEVTGHGLAYMGAKRFSLEERVDKARAAMEQALQRAGQPKDSLALICANGNSSTQTDLIEARAIQSLLGDRTKEVPVSSVKSQCGECYGASGAMQTALGLLAIEKSTIPPMRGYEVPDKDCDLGFVLNQERRQDTKVAMVNSLDHDGNCSCLILEKRDM